MATKFNQGDTVYVPCSRLGVDGISAFCDCKVVGQEKRSVIVSRLSSKPVRVASSLVRRNIGVLVLRVGDFASEDTLLDPLAKSALQYCRLLLPDDMVYLRRVRTLGEVSYYWGREHALYTHVVLISHGTEGALLFGSDTRVKPGQLSEALLADKTESKVWISLACETGKAAFAKGFSEASAVSDVIAPFHGIHGAVASQFLQNFLAFNLLKGMATGSAFNRAQKEVVGEVQFRLWRSGKLKQGRK